jgi:uncharacterized protein YdaU (DUF1376 family)
MNYYAFHIGDYVADTAHLTNEEDLCYRRAIDLYMIQEGPLGGGEANAKRTLSRRLRVDEQTLSIVLDEFFFLTENGYEHARCNAEIAKYKTKSDKAKEAGRLGGSRKGSKRKANAKQTLSERLTNAKLTNNQEPITNNQSTKNKQKVDDVVFPFDSESFKSAWSDWVTHRSEIKKKITPLAVKKQFSELASMGEKRAIEAIDHSIAKGWQSIHEPNLFSSTPKPQPEKSLQRNRTDGMSGADIGDF